MANQPHTPSATHQHYHTQELTPRANAPCPGPTCPRRGPLHRTRAMRATKTLPCEPYLKSLQCAVTMSEATNRPARDVFVERRRLSALTVVASSRVQRRLAVAAMSIIHRFLKKIPGGEQVQVFVGFCLFMGIGAPRAVRLQTAPVTPNVSQAWHPSHTRRPKPATTTSPRRSPRRSNRCSTTKKRYVRARRHARRPVHLVGEICEDRRQGPIAFVHRVVSVPPAALSAAFRASE